MPSAWRQSLAEQRVYSGRSTIHKEVKAQDGTIKFLLRLADNHVVETVGIPLDEANKQRLTVCVSSQVSISSLHSCTTNPTSFHSCPCWRSV